MGTFSDFDTDPSQRSGGIENRGDTIGIWSSIGHIAIDLLTEGLRAHMNAFMVRSSGVPTSDTQPTPKPEV